MFDRNEELGLHQTSLAAENLDREADAAYRIAGTLIVTLFPALFWTVALAAGGAAVGHNPSALVLATFASAIAAFLAAIWHALLRAVPD